MFLVEYSFNFPGIYLTISMTVTSVSVVFTVWVLKLHHCGPHQAPMPVWLQRFVRRCGGSYDPHKGSCWRGQQPWLRRKINAKSKGDKSIAAGCQKAARPTGNYMSGCGGCANFRGRIADFDENIGSARSTLKHSSDELTESSLVVEKGWKGRKQTTVAGCGRVESGNGGGGDDNGFDAFLSLVRQMTKPAAVQVLVESETVKNEPCRTGVDAAASSLVSTDAARRTSTAQQSRSSANVEPTASFVNVDDRTLDSCSTKRCDAAISHVDENNTVDTTTSLRHSKNADAVDTRIASATGSSNWQHHRTQMLCVSQVQPQAGDGGGGTASVGVCKRLAIMEETLRHLATIMSRVDTDNTNNEIAADWRSLAAIADRWLFWTFLTVTVAYTGVTMVLVPFYLQ